MPIKSKSIHQNISLSLLVAIVVCVFRITIFDGPVFFAYRGIPNHDILSGMIAFASSMYEIRVEGDIAWWFPSHIDGGDAGYYNFFLSPLAPTAGSPPFLLWCIFIKLISFLGFIIPEYRQFLIFNYVLMPIIAYSALFLLSTRIYKNLYIQILIVLAYAFSGTGIWNNAWMFYQEWSCLFLFLWAIDLFINRINILSFILLCISVINYSASVSYWTLFSSWLLITVIGLHILYFRQRWRRASYWIYSTFWNSRILFGSTILVFITCSMWGVTQGTIYFEQASNHMRSQQPDAIKNGFSLEDVYSRAQETDVRFFSIELFDPIIDRPLNNYQVINPAHNARYIGISFLPLICIFLILSWKRKDHIIFGIFLLTMVVSLTSGLFLLLWEIMPGMNVQRHMFYFYQYFLELILIIMGARALDILIERRAAWPWSIRFILIATAFIGLIGFIILYATADSFGVPSTSYVTGPFLTPIKLQNPKLKSIGFACFLLILSSVIIYRIKGNKKLFTNIYVCFFLILTVGDLMHFYWRASIADQQFTEYWRGINLVDGKLPDLLKKTLKTPWNAEKYDDLFHNLPILNIALLPVNGFNPSANVRRFNALTPDIKEALQPPGAIGLAIDIVSDSQGRMARYDKSQGAITSSYLHWDYNREILDVISSRAGLAVLPINYDPNWRVTIDGKTIMTQLVNIRMMAFDIGEGRHIVDIRYRPVSRIFYYIAAFLTLLTLGILSYFCVFWKLLADEMPFRQDIKGF